MFNRLSPRWLLALAIAAAACWLPLPAAVAQSKYPDGKVDFKVTSKELVTEFVKTPDKAKAKYEGKSLRVEGVISSIQIEREEDSTAVFAFLEGTDNVKVETVLYGKDAEKLKEGQKIAVFGKEVAYASGGGLVTLYQCELAPK